MDVNWLTIAAAPAGAIIGSSLTYKFTRPRLAAVIDEISIAPSRIASYKSVPVDIELQNKLRDFPEELAEISNVVIPERTYCVYLEMVVQQLKSRLATIELLLHWAEELRTDASTENFGQLIKRYRHRQYRLRSWATGLTARGKPMFTEADNDSPTDEIVSSQAHPWVETQDGDYAVELSGVIDLWFRRFESESPLVQARCNAMNRRASRAFAYHRRADLVSYFNAIKEEIEEVLDTGNKVLDSLNSKLRTFDRLKVELIVSNAGRTGVSIGARAWVKILIKGYVYRDASDGSTGKLVDKDVTVSMQVIEAGKVQSEEDAAEEAKVTDIASSKSSPILLQAGEAVRLVAISEAIIFDEGKFPYGRQVEDLYKSGERLLQVFLHEYRRPRRIRSKGDSVHILKTSKVLFRNITSFPK